MEKYIVINILIAIDSLTKKEIIIVTENLRNYDAKARLKRYYKIVFSLKLMKQFLVKNEEQKILTCEKYFIENKINKNVIYM